jgi:23S rRNA (guanine1835-N2)-methyltransferase
VGKQRLVDALSTLNPGGRCVLAGRPTGGLNRYEACLDRHADSVETLSKSGDVQVIAGTVSDPPDPPQFVEYNSVQASVDGIDLSLVTAPGLFSPTALDDGTRHLLETATVEDGERVLDLCCGCGPIGAYAASVADVDVVLADDDIRATDCARRTLDATGVNGTVRTSDCTRAVVGPFDRVLCNPPTHAGAGVLGDLFAGVNDVLASGGVLSVVHHRRLDLSDHLSRVGSIVEQVDGAEHTVVTVKK